MIQAACNDFKALAVLRALGGAAEACADPAFMLITSMWYTRREQPVRMGLWYTANGLGIALGGLLGYGIGNIKGALPSWKYEFIVMYVDLSFVTKDILTSAVAPSVPHGESSCLSSFRIRPSLHRASTRDNVEWPLSD